MGQKIFISVIILAAIVVTVILVVQKKNTSDDFESSETFDTNIPELPKIPGNEPKDNIEKPKPTDNQGIQTNEFTQKAEKQEAAEEAWKKIAETMNQLRNPQITEEKHKEVMKSLETQFSNFIENYRDVNPQFTSQSIYYLSKVYQILENHEGLEKLVESVTPDESIDTQLKIEIINSFLNDLMNQKQQEKALKYIEALMIQEETAEAIKDYLGNQQLFILFDTEKYDDVITLVAKKVEAIKASEKDIDKFAHAELLLWYVKCYDKQEKSDEDILAVKNQIEAIADTVKDEEMKMRIGYIATDAVRIVNARKIKVGAVPPNWTLQSIREDKDISLSDFKGRIVLLDFWATWCAPCKAFMAGFLSKWAEKYKDTDLAIIGMGTDWREETAEKQKAFLEEAGYNWVAVFDKDGKVSESYAVRGIPFVLVIGRDGKIAKVEAEFEDIEKYLDENFPEAVVPETPEENPEDKPANNGDSDEAKPADNKPADVPADDNNKTDENTKDTKPIEESDK